MRMRAMMLPRPQLFISGKRSISGSDMGVIFMVGELHPGGIHYFLGVVQ